MTFLDWYLHYCGDSEVPQRWHRWACLSLISAAVADRVVVDRGGSNSLAPNLYVFLIGPSGSGKEYAISKATSLAMDLPIFNINSGEITTRGIYKLLGEQDEYKNFVNTKCWLIMEELAQAISLKEEGKRVIRLMTKMYGRDPLPLDNKTGKWGSIRIPSPCMNALIGTTEQWLFDTISKSDIYSGYFARIQAVVDTRDHANPRPTITKPPDFQRIHDYLRWWVRWLSHLETVVTIDPQAKEWHRQWYINAPRPEDDLLQPHFNRRDELLHKLSVNLVLSRTIPHLYRPGHVLSITEADYRYADWLIKDVQKDLSRLFDRCGMSPWTAQLEAVERALQRAGQLTHRTLLQKVSPRGVSATQLRMIVDHLQQEEKLTIAEYAPLTYRWIG